MITEDSSQVVVCSTCSRRNRVPDASFGIPQCAACHQPLLWLVNATDSSFEAATAGCLPVLVDLWAPWCGPCRAVGPAVEESGRRLAGRLKIVKVDVDEAPGLSRRFGVQSIPMLLIVRDGKEMARHVGALPATALAQWIDRQLAAHG